MKIISKVLLMSAFMVSGGLASAQSQAYSDYTTIDFDDKQCRTIEKDDISNSTTKRCPSFANYKIERSDGDWTYLTLSYGSHKIFSMSHELGKKAEWRYRMVGNKKQYHGLIFRTLTMQLDDGMFLSDAPMIEKLVVMRLDKEKSCILGVLPVDKNTNEKARQLADDTKAICMPDAVARRSY